MSTTVTYKGNTIATLSNETKTLNTSGKWMEADVVVTDSSSTGTAAISVVDTLDSHGGTIRTINAIDISDTNATAADVANGKYFYTAAGVKTVGTATGGGSGGGNGGKNTGTVTGNGTRTIQIPCTFAPDSIFVVGDLSQDQSLRGIASVTIIKDTEIFLVRDGSSSSSNVSYEALFPITGYNESETSQMHAIYTNNTFVIDTGSSSSGNIFTEGITYSYELVAYGGGGGNSATQHTIHLEFTDSTDTDIEVDYDDTLIATMITSYTPETYGQKTVDSAALDGTVWYVRPTAVWETLYDSTVDYYPEENFYPYCWIAPLADVTVPTGSTWRVTFDGTTYLLTGYPNTTDPQHGAIGNPKFLAENGIDDGSGVPFVFYQTAWGAWSGSADVLDNSRHNVKIERQVMV